MIVRCFWVRHTRIFGLSRNIRVMRMKLKDEAVDHGAQAGLQLLCSRC